MQTIVHYTRQFIQYVRNNRAVSALEYAILVGIIATAIAGALITFGRDVTATIEGLGDGLTAADTAVPNFSGPPAKN